MKSTLLPFLFLPLLVSCSDDKEKPPPPKLFPVISYIKSQVAHVDTSLYPIMKITQIGDAFDTVFYKREEFKDLAREFTNLPDLTDSDYDGRYTKESTFDETMGVLIITMLPLEPNEENIQRQEVVIRPDPSGDRVSSIIINHVVNNRDSSVLKRMLWVVDESFQVTTIRQLKAQPEMTTTYRVVWNEPEPAYIEEKKEVE